MEKDEERLGLKLLKDTRKSSIIKFMNRPKGLTLPLGCQIT